MTANDSDTEVLNLWFEDYSDEQEDFQIDEYDITATPNDFNVLTIFSFMESGSVKIPGFQRNYVWDIARASKLIESLILGLPVPQIFLYEEARNKFLVIDGQQRLMSIYYFMKQKFPRKEMRAELRRIFAENGAIPDNILHDDKYFSNFNLNLPEKLPNHPNKFKGLNYATLNDYKSQFDLRPIRNVIVKQNSPQDDSSIYEIFNRLNSGGINLKAQEIRASLYHSNFYEVLHRLNTFKSWRRLLQMEYLDVHMKDLEVLLRGIAMLIDGDIYKPSLVKFLNQFSRKCQTQTDEQNVYIEALFQGFLAATTNLPDDVFLNKRTRRFNLALYEATFVGACHEKLGKREIPEGELSVNEIRSLETDAAFLRASQEGTTKTDNVRIRLDRGKELITAL